MFKCLNTKILSATVCELFEEMIKDVNVIQGGIKAVIWSQVLQVLLIVAAMLTVLVQAIIKSGGPSKMWQTYDYAGRLNLQ